MISTLSVTLTRAWRLLICGSSRRTSLPRSRPIWLPPGRSGNSRPCPGPEMIVMIAAVSLASCSAVNWPVEAVSSDTTSPERSPASATVAPGRRVRGGCTESRRSVSWP